MNRTRQTAAGESAATTKGVPSMAASALPNTLGRFELGAEIGRGGMGRVFEARDPNLKRSVAIKLLSARALDANSVARFVAEAQVTSQLEHPNIVPVHEIGTAPDGSPYFVMKKVTGRSLSQVLKLLRGGDPETRRHWTERRLLTVFVQMCQAVAYAHERGVLHRDLKPANVMLGAFGEVLVMDWGLASARLASDPEKPGVELARVGDTLVGVAVGTPGYLSPELASGEPVPADPRSDVWSLGSILYELLTRRPAIEGQTQLDLLQRTLAGPPPEPRKRAPELHIEDEIATVCMKALSREPRHRHDSAAALCGEVEAYLEGSRRREEALPRYEEARARWRAHAELGVRETELASRAARLEREVEPWRDLSDPGKAKLVAVTDELESLRLERAQLFSQTIAAAERALSHDPGFSAARELLASAYWSRYEEAESRRDRRDQAFYVGRASAYDPDGHARLYAPGSLSLQTSPAGAEVVCERFETEGLVWRLRDRRSLDRTPLSSVPLEPGSYRLTLQAPGLRDTVYPVHITRARHWDSGPDPLPLLGEAELAGADWVYVPAGPFLAGGDPFAGLQLPAGEEWLDGFLVARYPVTAGEYLAFLNDLHARNRDAAWARVPRNSDGGRYWKPGSQGYELPSADPDGDPWHPRYPVSGVSWRDAVAYAEWLSAQSGFPTRLATERQLEKAARGVDGRSFPWGDRYDASLSKTQSSRSGRPQPEPVGAFAGDRSVYGVADLAGSMRQWAGDEEFDGDVRRRPVRGGAWSGQSKQSRAANRFGYEVNSVHTFLGFRLARALPGAAGAKGGTR